MLALGLCLSFSIGFCHEQELRRAKHSDESFLHGAFVRVVISANAKPKFVVQIHFRFFNWASKRLRHERRKYLASIDIFVLTIWRIKEDSLMALRRPFRKIRRLELHGLHDDS